MQTEVRNTPLHQLGELLKTQHVRKIDVVAPADRIRMEDGLLVIEDVEPLIEGDGVTQVDGVYNPTEVFDEGISSKLAIPLAYLRRIHEHRTDLYDLNVNGWLYGADGGDPDPRSFLIRLFRGDVDGQGIGRAFLSSGFKVIDNLDVLMATIQGINDAGVAVDVAGCDLTDRRMGIRVVCKEIGVVARRLMAGYRSPYSGKTGEDMPMLFSGFIVGNSETGNGAFTITPRAVFQACDNGLTVKADQMREVHLGGKMDDGVIQWSEETQTKAVELVASKTKDAVRTFLSEEYLTKLLAKLEDKAEHEVPVKDVIQVVGKKLSFDEATIDGVLEAFMRGGQPTAGGVMQAITAYAQVEQNADKAAALEDAAIPALEFAATL
jgi:hypothetical protein